MSQFEMRKKERENAPFLYFCILPGPQEIEDAAYTDDSRSPSFRFPTQLLFSPETCPEPTCLTSYRPSTIPVKLALTDISILIESIKIFFETYVMSLDFLKGSDNIRFFATDPKSCMVWLSLYPFSLPPSTLPT